MRLTTQSLRSRWSGKDRWLSDGGGRGCGRLVARITQTGVWFYFLYSHGGKVKRYPLEPFDADGKRGMTLQQARDRAYELSRIYRAGDTDIHAYARHQVAQTVAARDAVAAAATRERDLAQQGSLQRLLNAYIDYLQSQGKPSARNVRYISQHLPPELLERRASSLAPEDFMSAIRALHDAGKGKTALDLRGYLHAAYALAEAAKTDPSIPDAFRVFGITSNAVKGVSVKGLSQYKRARRRSLDAHELGAYLARVDAMRKGATRDMLLLCLYLGGQRPEQLLRLEYTDVDLPGRRLVILDRKGRRRVPRIHPLPLVPHAMAILEAHALAARRVNILCVWGGLHRTTTGAAVRRISNAMVKSGEAREPFQQRDLRRTCETMLGAEPLSVPKDIRAHILSHGIAGVQDRVYDTNEYMPEKRDALERWAAHLDKLRAEHKVRQDHTAGGAAVDRDQDDQGGRQDQGGK